jgi:hypothetical protein
MRGQLWALLVLKFALLRHTWTRGKTASTLLSGLMLCVMFAISLGVSVGMVYLGRIVAQERAQLVLVASDVFVAAILFFWLFGLLIEIQRSDIIDFKKMLYFPISLGMVFLLNFVASLFSPGLLLTMLPLLGWVIGMSLVGGLGVLLTGVPLVIAFFLMLGAWGYFIRGWLAMLMENKRRRRLILTILPLCFVFMGQLPNLLNYSWMRVRGNEAARNYVAHLSPEQTGQWVTAANKAVPPGWLPYGLLAGLNGDPVHALAAVGGMGACAGIGLLFGYRATLRHYAGVGRPEKRVKRVENNVRPGAPWTARSFPGLDDDSSACVWAAFLSLIRHPQVRVAVLSPLAVGILLVVMFQVNPSTGSNSLFKHGMPLFFYLGWPFFSFSMIYLNPFGLERDSFLGMILLPTPRWKYLLARNLALFPFVGAIAAVFLAAGLAFNDIGWAETLQTMVFVFQFHLAWCVLGNFTGPYCVFRFQRDAMRAPTNRPIVLLMGLVSFAVTGLLCAMVAACRMLDALLGLPEGVYGIPTGVPASILILLATAVLYWLSLTPAGDLLLSREQKMFATLTKDRE